MVADQTLPDLTRVLFGRKFGQQFAHGLWFGPKFGLKFGPNFGVWSEVWSGTKASLVRDQTRSAVRLKRPKTSHQRTKPQTKPQSKHPALPETSRKAKQNNSTRALSTTSSRCATCLEASGAYQTFTPPVGGSNCATSGSTAPPAAWQAAGNCCETRFACRSAAGSCRQPASSCRQPAGSLPVKRD